MNWREIDRLRKNADEFRRLARHLLAVAVDDLTEWETLFLESVVERKGKEEFTTRQGEKLLEIRGNIEVIEVFHGFSVATLMRGCYEARLDLSEDDEQWIVAVRSGRGGSIRRKNIGRLMRCARHLGLVDEMVAE